MLKPPECSSQAVMLLFWFVLGIFVPSRAILFVRTRAEVRA